MTEQPKKQTRRTAPITLRVVASAEPMTDLDRWADRYLAAVAEQQGWIVTPEARAA